MTILHIDVETASVRDLKVCGAHTYFEDPSTRILCMAWAIDDGKIDVIDYQPNKRWPDELLDALNDPNVEIHAWNANFEWLALRRLAFLPVSRFECTMIRAAYWGLPMSLEMAADALLLPTTKDMQGRRHMLRCAKPQKNGYLTDTDPTALDKLMAYCAQDVAVERAIGAEIPDLPKEEWNLWLIDQCMNEYGWRIDTDLIKRLQRMVTLAEADLEQEFRDLTCGLKPSQVAEVMKWLKSQGCPVPDLSKASVAEALARPGHGDLVRRVLEIRQEISKSSTKKLKAMTSAAGSGNRIRGLTQFYGASRTGRWAGRLTQIQNLARPILKNVGEAVQDIKSMDGPIQLDRVRDFLGRPHDVASSLLRACFIPSPGKSLIVGDFSQIEARVIAWLAGQNDALQVFRSGQDIYVHTANAIGSTNRQLGKVLVLACGFGMGAGKFRDTAATYGITLDEQQAKDLVVAWRRTNMGIVRFWWAMEAAVERVLSGGSKTETVGPIQIAMGGKRIAGCLLIRLPSGRHLVYRNARIKDDQITYDGVNQTTRQWQEITTYGGKLAENVTQAVAADCLRMALRRSCNRVNLIATIHDEIVAETVDAEAGVHDVRTAMTMPMPWAQDLPLAADVKALARYGK